MNDIVWQVRKDYVLLHTTCGSLNYEAPDILQSIGYDGDTSDMWSCGVTLYVILTGYVPFDDRNRVVLYQRMVPLEAKNLINRMHDPNAKTRITMADIKTEEWFKQDYTPAVCEEEEEYVLIDDEVLSLHETVVSYAMQGA
nr:CBL-interacting serine/threonine-protein kinase 1 isoform X3 [Tanacetum cinerariifolium]